MLYLRLLFGRGGALEEPSHHLTALLRILDEAFDTKGWQGTVLRGVAPAQAVWRPAPDRHSIRDLACHCPYWKYTVRRRLVAARRGSFPRKGSNW